MKQRLPDEPLGATVDDLDVDHSALALLETELEVEEHPLRHKTDVELPVQSGAQVSEVVAAGSFEQAAQVMQRLAAVQYSGPEPFLSQTDPQLVIFLEPLQFLQLRVGDVT